MDTNPFTPPTLTEPTCLQPPAAPPWPSSNHTHHPHHNAPTDQSSSTSCKPVAEESNDGMHGACPMPFSRKCQDYSPAHPGNLPAMDPSTKKCVLQDTPEKIKQLKSTYKTNNNDNKDVYKNPFGGLTKQSKYQNSFCGL
jgi:hypothetical protein